MILALAAVLGACGQSPAEIETRQIIETYFEALNSRDASGIPLATDVSFSGPMVPEGIQGEAGVREFLQGTAERLRTITVERIFVDGERACAPFVLDVENGPSVSGVDCFRVVGGQLVEIQPYFDPRPLLPD